MGVIRGSSYYTTIYGPSWSQAATASKNLGGYLASVTTEAEFNFLQENNFKGWIGLSDPDNTGPVNADGSRGGWGKHGFNWESGEAYNFESWMQPVFNTDGNYVHFWDGHGGGGDTDMLATNEIPPNAPWWEGKGIAEIPLSYFSISDAEVEEGEKGKIKITRTGGTSTKQTLILATSDGSAVAGDDYKKKTKTITFAAGETSKTVNIVTIEDTELEFDEAITLTLTASSTDAVPAQIQNGSATLTIKDSLDSTRIEVIESSVWEGDTAEFTLRRIGDLSKVFRTAYYAYAGKWWEDEIKQAHWDRYEYAYTDIVFKSNQEYVNGYIKTYDDDVKQQETEAFNIFVQNGDRSLAQGRVLIYDDESKSKPTRTLENDNQFIINNTINITYNYYNSNNATTTVNSNNNLSSWNIYRVDQTVKARDIVGQWFWDATPISALSQDVTDTKLMDVIEKTWSDKVQINRVVQAKQGGGELVQGRQLNKSAWDGVPKGSVLNGSAGGETLRGLAGWDIIDGGDGDDLIHGGNGRDIITGGAGSDELHGDFGWNTYKDQRDGSIDLIAIKSDQHLNNWWYGTSGNSPNGEKADFIEGLDAKDQIKIIGVFSQDLSFKENVTARGVSGIGIYAKGALEAIYTGGKLSTSQIQNMTTGDGSTAAMNNQMWSYWGDNTVPPMQT
ncbi:Calx-beta domain-containing protein [Synechococcus sp. N26]|uniref:Calx-beta domain-containing protein n=1 Tax=Synechococcus sp. N26 TaxID=2575513 RepID=UPI000E0E0F69|nr:Calx-beta domain-containing protein [Synechococcus sp. N26]